MVVVIFASFFTLLILAVPIAMAMDSPRFFRR